MRGPVQEFRSDRGTNFIGALDDLHANALFIEDVPVQNFLSSARIKWTFNPPHASHMAGSWERMIGIARKILDAMLLNTKAKELSHEVLCTFMCEVTAIMNSRPICSISTDSEDPIIVSPSLLLTQKNFNTDVIPVDSTSLKDIYTAQWKHVQQLSNTFWKRWKERYIQNLQIRRKWQNVKPDLKPSDVVLLRDKSLYRGQWPVGLVNRVFPSDSDGKVRTIEIRVIKDNKPVYYVRPITEVVLLIE